jgi:transcriptional regulator with XRE-family HTH domain
MSVTYVGQLERGERDPGLGALNKLAEALGVSLPSLLADPASGAHMIDLEGISPEGRQLMENMLREVRLYEAVRPRDE